MHLPPTHLPPVHTLHPVLSHVLHSVYTASRHGCALRHAKLHVRVQQTPHSIMGWGLMPQTSQRSSNAGFGGHVRGRRVCLPIACRDAYRSLMSWSDPEESVSASDSSESGCICMLDAAFLFLPFFAPLRRMSVFRSAVHTLYHPHAHVTATMCAHSPWLREALHVHSSPIGLASGHGKQFSPMSLGSSTAPWSNGRNT